MVVKVDRKLPDSEVYACSKSDAKGVLGSLGQIEVHFGARAHFEFDAQCHHKPDLRGSVVASVRVSRERQAVVQFYPIRREAYSPRERRQFVQNQLTKIHDWTRAALAVPDTEVLGQRELIIESVVDGFAQHDLTFG